MGGTTSYDFGRFSLQKDPVSTKLLRVTSDLYEGWIQKYGDAVLQITSSSSNIIFAFKKSNNTYYTINYDTNLNSLTSNAGNKLSTSIELVVSEGTDYNRIVVVQHASSTFNQTAGFNWHIDIQINRLPVNENILTVSVEIADASQTAIPGNAPILDKTLAVTPRIRVEFTPIQGFEELSNVIFFLNEDIGCAMGKYNQLLGSQSVHVLSPFFTCYLAGVGQFATEKMASVNGTQNPVWPEVSLYAMVKFILGRLMTGVFTMKVLKRKYTESFLKSLAKSKYSNFLEYFEQNKDLEKYFR